MTNLVTQFCMSDWNPLLMPFYSSVKLSVDCTTPLLDATLYCQLVGSLIYLTHNRFNIYYFVSMVSRFMRKSHEVH